MADSYMAVFNSLSPKDTAEIAENFASTAEIGQCFALHGPLGVGKTTFAQAFIKFKIPSVDFVNSPTFNIIQLYYGTNICLLHADFYRLKNVSEFLELGMDEYLETCICLIEWPEIAQNFLSEQTIDIYFSKSEVGITISSYQS